MQAEYKSGSSVTRKGMISSFMSMFKEEGVRGLYRVISALTNHILVRILNTVDPPFFEPWLHLKSLASFLRLKSISLGGSYAVFHYWFLELLLLGQLFASLDTALDCATDLNHALQCKPIKGASTDNKLLQFVQKKRSSSFKEIDCVGIYSGTKLLLPLQLRDSKS